MPTVLKIDTTELMKRLEELYLKGANFEKIKQDIGASIVETIGLAFKDEQDPYGTNWQPLKWRQGQILTDTGQLNKSITYKVNGQVIDFGTNLIYAPTHQFGRTAMKIYPKNKKALFFKGAGLPFKSANVGEVPARPFLPTTEGGLPQSWRDVIQDVFEAHLKRFER